MPLATSLIAKQPTGTLRVELPYASTTGSVENYTNTTTLAAGANTSTNILTLTTLGADSMTGSASSASWPVSVHVTRTGASADYIIHKAYNVGVFKQTGGTVALSAITDGATHEGTGSQNVVNGTTGTVVVSSVTADYVFLGWYSGDTRLTTSTTYNFTVSGANLSLTAKFSYTRHTLTVVPATGSTVKVEVDSGDGYTVLDDAVAASANFTLLLEGSLVRLTATLPYYATFMSWTSTVLGTLSTNPCIFAVPTSDATVTLVAPANPTVAVTVTNAAPTKGSFIVRTKIGAITVYTDTGAATAQSFTLYNGVQYQILSTASDALLYVFEKYTYTFVYNGTPSSPADTTTNPFTFGTTVAASGYSQHTFVISFISVPTYSLVTRVCDSATYTDPNAAKTAGCAVSVTPAPNATPEYVLNTSLTFSATPAARWVFAGWRIDYGGGGGIDLPATNPLVVPITADWTVTAIFTPTVYDVELTVDAPSLAASAGTVELQNSSAVAVTNPYSVAHGTTLIAVATAAYGFAFEGWYKDDVKITTAASTYYFTAVEDTELVAKFSADVAVTLNVGSGAAGTVWFVDADGTNLHQCPYTETVTVGDTFYLRRVLLNGSTFFRGYYEDGATQVFADQTGETIAVAIDRYLDITAFFDIDEDLVYLRMTNDPDGVEDTGLGILGATGAVDELTPAEWEAVFNGGTPGGIDAEGRNRYYSFNRGDVTSLSAVPLTSRGFVRWMVRDVDPSVSGPFFGNESQLSLLNPAGLLMYRNLSVRAEWVSDVPVSVSALYATGSDSTEGSLVLSPAGINRVTIPAGVIAEFIADEPVTVTAVPANGYVFAGWYSEAAATTLVSASQTYAPALTADVVLYAKFTADVNAVYVFEGGTAPKYTLWRSKRMEAAVPFDPSCARVFSDGYPVVFCLYACSSPLSPSPTVPSKRVSVFSQDAFRLPSGRKEKYFEIEVQSSYPVLEVVMSSSMKGLVQ